MVNLILTPSSYSLFLVLSLVVLRQVLPGAHEPIGVRRQPSAKPSRTSANAGKWGVSYYNSLRCQMNRRRKEWEEYRSCIDFFLFSCHSSGSSWPRVTTRQSLAVRRGKLLLELEETPSEQTSRRVFPVPVGTFPRALVRRNRKKKRQQTRKYLIIFLFVCLFFLFFWL